MLKVGNTVKTMTLLLASSQPETVSPSTSDVPTSEPTASFNDILPGTSLLKKNHLPDTSMISSKLQCSKSKKVHQRFEVLFHKLYTVWKFKKFLPLGINKSDFT